MKAYLIDPPFDMYGTNDERTSPAIDLIARMVFDCLRSGGDRFHYVADWANPGEAPGGPVTIEGAEPHIVSLHSDDALMDRLKRSIDPHAGTWGTIRSIATCRCVTFGYDGQAFLCLRHEDDLPVSPDPQLAVVEERSDLLAHSDYFDGFLAEPEPGRGAIDKARPADMLPFLDRTKREAPPAGDEL
jgi:hypothetical protein